MCWRARVRFPIFSRMRILPLGLALSLTALLTACGSGDAGDALTSDIVRTPMVTLDGVGDSIDLAFGSPAISSSGLIVAPLDDPPSGAIGVFDSTGRFVRRIGRAGGGPGEFRDVESVGFGPGDSIWVVDRLFAAHLFTPLPAGEYVRTVRLERANTGRVTPYGFLSAGVYTNSGFGTPHLAAWDGTLRAEFGAAAPAADMHDRMGPPALRDSAHAWVGFAKRYIIELLGTDGQVHQRIERDLPWFPLDTTKAAPWDGRPTTKIHSMQVDRDGLLWVLIRRANANWKPPAPRTGAGGPAPIEARNVLAIRLAEVFEGTIEVLDPRDGRLIATTEVGGGVLGFIAPDLLYEIEQDELGHVRTQLVRLSLRSRDTAASPDK